MGLTHSVPVDSDSRQCIPAHGIPTREADRSADLLFPDPPPCSACDFNNFIRVVPCIFVPCGILLRWCPRVLRSGLTGEAPLVVLRGFVSSYLSTFEDTTGGAVGQFHLCLITLYQVTVVSLCSFYVPRIPDRHVPAMYPGSPRCLFTGMH